MQLARCQRFAAIDIGTVTCRMLVADVASDGVRELDREYAITNLGEGVDATGVLKESAMDRVMAAIDSFLTALSPFDTAETPVRIIAMATSASRDAKNADVFVARLKERGIQLSVIPGEREAALSFRGASSCFAGEHLVVFDIGGGSTEIAFGCAGQDPLLSHSFNIGCRRMTEKLFSQDPPLPEEIEAARAWVREETGPFFACMREQGGRVDRMVGVAGTATSVVSVREAMEVYDTARVHKSVVAKEDLDALLARFCSVGLEERRAIVGLDPDRAPVIVAGMVILQEVLALGGFESFTVSECDILHGMMMDVFGR